MIAVPLILERLHSAIRAKIRSRGPVFESVFDALYRYRLWWTRRGCDTPVLNRVLFSKFRMALGGRVGLMVGGGAPLAAEVRLLVGNKNLVWFFKVMFTIRYRKILVFLYYSVIDVDATVPDTLKIYLTLKCTLQLCNYSFQGARLPAHVPVLHRCPGLRPDRDRRRGQPGRRGGPLHGEGGPPAAGGQGQDGGLGGGGVSGQGGEV